VRPDLTGAARGAVRSTTPDSVEVWTRTGPAAWPTSARSRPGASKPARCRRPRSRAPGTRLPVRPGWGFR